MRTSGFLSINTRDTIKALLIAVGGAVWALMAENIEKVITTHGAAPFIFDWVAIARTAAATAGVFLVKKFFTPAKIVIPVNETVETTIND